MVATLQKRQGLQVACLEEIVWRNKWISDDDLTRLGELYSRPSYAAYIRGLVKSL